jgi:3-phenylpropionate/trans-cinnamate dioxygenase ferredoxin subunit
VTVATPKPELGDRVVVARVADVPPGERLIVELDGRSIGIFNVDGEFFAILNRCPHMGAELCKGDILGLVESDRPGDVRLIEDRKYLACPWHGWEFDLRTGQSWFNPLRTRAKVYSVDVEDGAKAQTSAQVGGEVAEFDQRRHGTRGPFVASTFPIEVDDEYLVITLKSPRQ